MCKWEGCINSQKHISTSFVDYPMAMLMMVSRVLTVVLLMVSVVLVAGVGLPEAVGCKRRICI